MQRLLPIGFLGSANPCLHIHEYSLSPPKKEKKKEDLYPCVDTPESEKGMCYLSSTPSNLQPNHNMSDQLQKKPSFLSVLSSPFRASRKRSPSPNNAAQPVAIPSRSAGMSSGAPLSPEPIAGSSRLLPLIRTVDESPNQQLHQNTSNPQR